MKMVLHSKPWITPEDVMAVSATMSSGMIGSGAKTVQFEEEFSHWVNASNPGIAVGSGRAALALALHALGIGPDHEVILPTYVCKSVMQAVWAVGATPVLCDVGEDWLMHVDHAFRCISNRTCAVIVPHMYGLFADVESFRSLNIPIVEDSAQALDDCGERTIEGDVAIFSFHPTKCLTTGEGGMVLSRNAATAETVRRIRDGQVMTPGYRCLAPMSDFSAALGLSQLQHYSEALARRKTIAKTYDAALTPIFKRADWSPSMLNGMLFRYPIRLHGGLDRFRDTFLRGNVTLRRGVDQLLHRILKLPDHLFPNATQLFQDTVSLPIYPALTEQELATCIDVCISAFTATDNCTHKDEMN